ncbi:MAG TPA: hypothetical protein VMZ11_08755, partial [Mycobacteriales bacterium]|nr:hypothetical protein [Mycobacteriales bacterium]
MSSELAPPPSARRRRAQRLEAVRVREHQIARLQTEQRLELARLATEDLAGLNARYVADELALLWRRSPRQARNRLDAAQLFAAFPAVHALVGDGTWLLDHADAVLEELAGSGLDQAPQQEVLELVLSRRVARTPWELRAAVRTAIVVLFPAHAADRAEKAQADRRVRMHPEAPGAASLHVSGPAPAIAAMFASLDALSFPPAPEDARPVEARRFDALYELVCGRARPGQWQAQVLVGMATVQGGDELPAEIPGLGPIPARQAREIVAGAHLRRVVVDQASGRLHAVDEHVHRPDLPAAAVPAAVAVQHGRDDAHAEPVEPDPDAPNAQDLAWAEAHTDRDLLYGHLQQPHRAEESAAPTAALVHLSWQWSATALTEALSRIRIDPVRPLDLHTDRYAVPARLKRHLVLRDRTCVFPGCSRKAQQCDKDHLLPWPRGSTSEANLASECEHHHQGKHDCLTVDRLPDGTFRWSTPSGITADTPPRPVLDGWT